ncbi:MAG: DivIVA domain-containing protein [Oscillospiraceae bacterium]|nr:DivIVA domain-containing protein [Oscillospiraceae bacterium]
MIPKDISEKKFEKTKVFGYKPTDVDKFMSEVFESFNKIYQEKEQLEKKVDFLVEKLTEYRQQEGKLTDVLLEAKKVSDNVVKKANDQADLILSEAETKSNEMISSAKKEVDKEKKMLSKLQKESSDFKSKIISLYKSHIDLISMLPSYKEDPEINNNISDEEVLTNKTSKLKERTFSISLDKNGTPIKIDEENLSDTKNISLGEDIKKISDQYNLSEEESKKFKEPLKFGSNYNFSNDKNKKK